MFRSCRIAETTASGVSAANFSAAQPNIPLPPGQIMALDSNNDVGSGRSNQTAHEIADHSGSASNIESAVQEADVETQHVIQNQRQAKETSEPTQYGEDILSSRRDPNALKEHLLKMTADHRAGMANKRGSHFMQIMLHALLKLKRSINVKEDHHPGNVEIGNGYGVPGGGAYYAANLSSVQMNTSRDGADKAKGVDDLPDFLKQRLRARGILKVEATNNSGTIKQNVACQIGQKQSSQELLLVGYCMPTFIFLVEAKDPSTGASYFCNQSTGMSQWDRPGAAVNTMQHQVPSSLPENWEEALDESTGQKYYYNTKTQATQWEPPTAMNPIWNPQMQRCLGCGGWGVGLVHPWGYCDHCTRVQNLPFQQHSSYPNNTVQWSGTNATKNQGNIAAKERSSGKPPFGKANRKDHRKRNHPEDDELDPMDPSSYSDAPRGGWVVGLKGVQPRAADTSIWTFIPTKTISLPWCSVEEKCRGCIPWQKTWHGPNHQKRGWQ
ncbi:hypothetical protein GUJ93_ZPchr0001g32524 [Zizania palustris]|uniref:WW domain-containing protein n=1 Tax=Zizania palustris TaxID=103762 RepID=A0A8J5R915_ZIZPA|nr:hypothetical protein GUJ93_ZPchr0001g32524 [Zizania palustris]